jgi:hypothetical protein
MVARVGAPTAEEISTVTWGKQVAERHSQTILILTRDFNSHFRVTFLLDLYSPLLRCYLPVQP